MTYRNNLAASQAQNQALRLELSRKEKEIARLQGEAEPSRAFDARPGLRLPARATLSQARSQATRAVRYVAPPSYFPLFPMWGHGLSKAIAWCSSLSVASTESDTVVVWLAHKIVRSLLIIPRAITLLAVLVIVAPLTAINTALYSLALLPIVLVSGFRFSNRGTSRNDRWIDGCASADEDEVFLFFMLMPPLVFPGLYSILGLFGAFS